jgi:hypothetical protein
LPRGGRRRLHNPLDVLLMTILAIFRLLGNTRAQ